MPDADPNVPDPNSMGVTINAGNNITNKGTIDVSAGAGGDVNLDAGGLLTVTGGITGGNVTLIGGTGITHTDDGDVTSDGTITAKVEATATTGDILMADGTLCRAGGDVSLTAGRNVDLGRIDAGNNTIRVTATNGQIRDITAAEGPNKENLVGGAINLIAGQGIGGATRSEDKDLDIAATSLDAMITGSSGGIFIKETDNLALGHIVAGGGVGEITIESGSTGVAGGLTDKSPMDDSQENLVGGTINLTAVGGAIGGSGDADIDTTVTSIDAQTTSGGIFITETDGVQLGNLASVTAPGAIEVTTTAGDLQVSRAVTAGGGLRLDAAGQLNIAAAVRGSHVGLTGGTGIGHTAAGDVTSGGTLTATATTGDIGMVDDTVYSAGRSVSLTAARMSSWVVSRPVPIPSASKPRRVASAILPGLKTKIWSVAISTWLQVPVSVP